MIKFLLAIVGFLYFRWAGALFGYIIGIVVERMVKAVKQPSQQANDRQYHYSSHISNNPFLYSLLVLTAEILRANGKVLRAELDFVKRFYVANFGIETTREALIQLKELLKQNLPLNEAAAKVSLLDYSSKLQLLHFLFGIAQADGYIDNEELNVLERIARLIGLTQADFTSAKALFVKNNHWAYDVLEISPEATDEETKKAFRNMAIKHHPDKVAHQGEAVQKAAAEKMKRINEAYEYIKKQRGMN